MPRLPKILPLVAFLCALALPVSAQSSFTQGDYEFESCGAGCTLSGSYVNVDNGGQQYLVTFGPSSNYVEFQVTGSSLTIVRAVSFGFSAMDVCVDGSCTTVSNSNSATVYNAGHVKNFSRGTHTIRIVGANVYLDQFYVSDDAPVPTATILPSSTPAPTVTPAPTATPAYTATPQPTWTLAPSITPQPTATPMSGTGGIDICVYATLSNGQVACFEYSATAGSVHIANLLTLLLLSFWAFFIFGVFVLARKKSGGKQPGQ